MPFSSSQLQTSASYNGVRVSLGTASIAYVVDLPQGTTSVSFWGAPGAADYLFCAYVDVPPAGSSTADLEAVVGTRFRDQVWISLPVLRPDRPRIAFSVEGAQKTLHSGTPVVYVVPEIDATVAQLRGR